MDSPPGSRVDPLAPPSSGPGSPGYVAPVSPTGQPIIPPRWVPYLVAFGGACLLVAGAPAAGIAVPAALLSVAYFGGGLSALLLGMGPGMRKPPQ